MPAGQPAPRPNPAFLEREPVILRIEGRTPLMMHNVRLADPDDPIARQIADLTAKKKNMTQADRLEVSRLKFFGGMYYDPEAGPYLPAENLFASLIEGARQVRKGKAVEAGLVWLADKAPLQYDGPRDPDRLWNGGDSQFIDRRMVAVNRVRVVGVRPIFPKWAAEFPVEFDSTALNLSDLRNYARAAGRVGVGDYRRFYGKYQAAFTEE